MDGAKRVAANPHRRLAPSFKDVVVDLERDHARDHEVDLFLARVAMPVTAATTGPGGHPAPGEGDLLGRNRVRVPALFAVAGVLGHDVERLLAAGDGIRIDSAAGHRRPSFRSQLRSSPSVPAGATGQLAEPPARGGAAMPGSPRLRTRCRAFLRRNLLRDSADRLVTAWQLLRVVQLRRHLPVPEDRRHAWRPLHPWSLPRRPVMAR